MPPHITPAFLRGLGFKVVSERSTSSEIVIICEQCGDTTGNRSVSVKTGLTNCFRCNVGGSFVWWARKLGYQIEDDLLPKNAAPIEHLNFNPSVDQRELLPVVADIKLPEGFTYCHAKPDSIYTKLIGKMAARKNLATVDFLEAKVGYTKICTKWEPYAIFPVTEYGRTVYYQGRTYVDVPGESTKLFPNRQEAPYGARYWIYGIDELRASKAPVAIVVESILNVLSLRRYMLENGLTGAAPVCIFKHYLSKPQARKLMQVKAVKEICLLYDHDAIQASWQKSPLLIDRVKTSVAEMPPGPGGEKNDANDDPAAAWQAFENRKVSDGRNALAANLQGGFSRGSVSPVLRPVPTDPLLDLKI